MKPTKKILTPDERWEQGVPHNPKSVELVKAIDQLDWKYSEGGFDFKMGGDGDSGETLAYLLDMYFEAEEKVDKCTIGCGDLHRFGAKCAHGKKK